MTRSCLPGTGDELDAMRSALKPVDETSAGTPCSIRFAGQDMLLDPAGVAYFPTLQALLVADLHLEKGSSFARRRQYLPPYDTAATLARLSVLITKYEPKTVISLGDSFHDDEASQRLSDETTALISALAAGRQFIWITGNHDPSPPENVPGMAASELAFSGVTLRHIPDRKDNAPEIAGHLHPCARIRVRGKSVRRSCFATDGKRLVMPSFGVYTGGLNVRNPAFRGLFSNESLCAYMQGSDRIFPISGKNLIGD